MSAESEDRTGARDLDLTAEDADRVKGGRLDPGPGGSWAANQVLKRRHKRSKKSRIGPYKGKH
jgi:hypothetical protein